MNPFKDRFNTLKPCIPAHLNILLDGKRNEVTHRGEKDVNNFTL
jgi:hypothetical protein